MKSINNIKEFNSLKDPPANVYYKGNLELLKNRKIAIIGSRKMSVYTKNCIYELVNCCKSAQICIVSGGALGVDITAANAAFPNTIAIFANGLDEIYPKSNKKYIEQIYEHALALSEHEAFYKPKPYDFLLRNRLIIALSEVVIIAQADLYSGSMQSARLALSMKKPIYVLPQRRQESEGTNLLLAKNQAKLLYDFSEFASMFGVLEEKSNNDELLEFIKKENNLDKILQKFGDRIYEYELEGLVEICGLSVRVKS
ncbi:DNA-processing protein DprA [Campylobacter volucris]|uniref:DNA-processing protein DprA n=1 Tax=Campylobacter volucris TaxID=1031542 RepID=A0AAE6CZP2_9BACT|nr:DNA-processing protein DprA [Campylobacter volucris]AJC94227.1 DNA protecting protein DprA [Campylobacter volucris LMG 24379]KAB0580382.1 DNA-processing protein DprA [Campylobacter volucris]MBF7043090.1 DNA-protecting protein DprA [Campylobacter volucris]MBF7045040.1 DNA-protecting protein DprA [Campylobacter volucris]MBF7046739.1 DNA-protecting protein DprA [Campylobacter volucris]